jgi:DNA/RNA endonuclease YhcR with UshA esterase domain
MRAFVFAAALVAMSTPMFAAVVISTDAAKFAGQNVTIEGVVTEVRVSQNGTAFIDMDGKYPNNQFTAVVFPQNIGNFDNVKSYEGKTVQISGPVAKYEGKAEIGVRGLGQIQVVNPARHRKLS